MDKLLPCPFCGGKAEYYQWSIGQDYIVRCGNCGIGTLDEDLSLSSVTNQWNTRVPDPDSSPEGFIEE